MNKLLGGNECEILTHSQQQPQAPNAHKRSQQSGCLPESQYSGPPKGLSFTGLRTQLKSSTRHTLSNQQAQPKETETVNLTENAQKGHFYGSFLFL